MFKILIEAFRSKGFEGYESKEAQQKFADSLLKIADKTFWAPMAFIGITLYQGEKLPNYGLVFTIVFMVVGVVLRHEGLKVYDLHAAQEKARKNKEKRLNKI